MDNLLRGVNLEGFDGIARATYGNDTYAMQGHTRQNLATVSNEQAASIALAPNLQAKLEMVKNLPENIRENIYQAASREMNGRGNGMGLDGQQLSPADNENAYNQLIAKYAENPEAVVASKRAEDFDRKNDELGTGASHGLAGRGEGQGRSHEGGRGMS